MLSALHSSAGRTPGAHDALSPRDVLVMGTLSPAQLLVALLRADAARPLLAPSELVEHLSRSERMGQAS